MNFLNISSSANAFTDQNYRTGDQRKTISSVKGLWFALLTHRDFAINVDGPVVPHYY